MRTLNRYFGRELLRGFALTAITLTMLVVMGGGLSSVFKSQGIGAGEIFNIFLYLIPIALILMLPLAALFAGTITYGRAAADNEILACRAAGVNVHKLLVPPLVMGLLISAVWIWGLNFFIPSMLWKVEDISRRDIPGIVANRLLRGKPLSYANFTITAKECDKIDAGAIDEEFVDKYLFLHLAGVSFMEMNNERLVRVGTANRTIIQFDNSQRTPQIKVKLQDGRSFDADRNQYFEFEEQVLGPIEIPIPIKRKIRFEKLFKLLEFNQDPLKIPEVQDLMHGMRKELKVYFLARKTNDIILPTGKIEYVDQENQTRIKIEAEAVDINQDDGRISLKGVKATVWKNGEIDGTHYLAEFARIELQDSAIDYQPDVVITLEENVRITPANAPANARIIRKPSETLPRVPFKDQPEIAGAYHRFIENDIQTIFDRDYEGRADSLQLFAKQKKRQRNLANKHAQYQSEILGEIHFRASISITWIAVIIIGALLGIILRSGQALVAFFISCIPCLFMLIVALVARNQFDKPDRLLMTLGLLWANPVILYSAAWIIGTRYLRR